MSDPWLMAVTLLGLLGLLAVVVVGDRWQVRRWFRVVEHMARTFGLDVEAGGDRRARSASQPLARTSARRWSKAQGEVGEIPVTFGPHRPPGSKQIFTRIVARPAHLPADFTLERKGFLGRLLPGADHVVGDAAFDRTIAVRGEETCVRALLDEPTRALIQASLAQGIEVREGEVSWMQQGWIVDVPRLEQRMNQVLELARALDPSNLRARLLQVVRTDPHDAVVVGALRAFLKRWPPPPKEAAALLADPRTDVRLLVAPFVGQDAWDVTLKLLDDDEQDTRIRVRALEALRAIDGPRAVPVALDRIGRAQPAMALPLLDLLASAQTCPPLADLAAFMASGDAPLSVALAHCLAHSAEGAEAQLLELLADSDEAVATAAARALARRGTVAALTPLRRRAGRLGVGFDLERAVEAATAAIQGRVGHLGGRLSLLQQQRAEGGLTIQKTESSHEDG